MIVTVYIGAFFEAYVSGIMTAELQRIQDKEIQLTKVLEYIKCSSEIHHFPSRLTYEIRSHINSKSEVLEVTSVYQNFQNFMTFLSPSHYYQVQKYSKLDTLRLSDSSGCSNTLQNPNLCRSLT